MRTPEQRDADVDLRAAIERVAQLQAPEGEDDGLLVDFVVVAQYTRFTDEGDETSAYFMQYPNGSIPSHRALGLLRLGMKFLMDDD